MKTYQLDWKPVDCGVAGFVRADYMARDARGCTWFASYRCKRTNGQTEYNITCDLNAVTYFGCGLPSAYTAQSFIPATVPPAHA